MDILHDEMQYHQLLLKLISSHMQYCINTCFLNNVLLFDHRCQFPFTLAANLSISAVGEFSPAPQVCRN